MGKLAKSAMERESVSGSITKRAGGLAPVACSGSVCASPSGIARRLLPSLRPSRLPCAAAGLGQPIAVAMAAVCGGGARPAAPARASRAFLPARPIRSAPAPPRPEPRRGFDTRGIRQGCARGRRRSRRGGGGSRAAPGWAAASRPGEGREGGGQVGRAGRAVRGGPGPLPRERGGPGGAARGAADPRPQLIPAAPRQLPQRGRSRGPACPRRHRAPRPGRAWSPRGGERPVPVSLRCAGPAAGGTSRRRRERGLLRPRSPDRSAGSGRSGSCLRKGGGGQRGGGGPRCGQLPPIPPAAAPGMALPGRALPELSLGRRLQPDTGLAARRFGERPWDRASPEPGHRARGFGSLSPLWEPPPAHPRLPGTGSACPSGAAAERGVFAATHSG
nr:translation initiation factor IF-2-like [Taeniopygia guttata]XP_041576088.1 translation initiation factor IF-2-like [Taeniopygia guttata]XP_041576089.1 translation initiation factor IF-2-like [Taeniopygia guttata]